MTAPLADRLDDAAEAIELWNVMCGLGENATVSPRYLRREAARMRSEDD